MRVSAKPDPSPSPSRPARDRRSLTCSCSHLFTMALTDLWSSLLSTVHADAPEEKEEAKEEEAAEEPTEEAAAEEEEEEEPEDVRNRTIELSLYLMLISATNILQALPDLQEECKQSAKCAAATQAFARCEEKVNAGQGYKGETCIEELYVSYNLSPSVFAHCTFRLVVRV